jgi:methylthioribose-1-phosphate isomerase
VEVDGRHYRTLWLGPDGWSLEVIDQRRLPHQFEVATLRTVADVVHAIVEMQVRGAPLIGVAAAYGICLALRFDPSDAALERASALLLAARPTAVNLRWAILEMRRVLLAAAPSARVDVAYARAARMADDEAAAARALGEQGQRLIDEALVHKGGRVPVNVLTHCNAGWLATVDFGTALAPIYRAHERGIPLHVWVDETRPRNQGASLTAWELAHHGVPHTLVADNTGGHLMQHGMVDLCIVGSDRTTSAGDVCNKIGTYLKALAAHDNGVPFYVALPFSTVDWELRDGLKEIPIEERASEEVTHITGKTAAGDVVTVTIAPEGTPAANFAFDVTPARYVTALITERGICAASAKALAQLREG